VTPSVTAPGDINSSNTTSHCLHFVESGRQADAVRSHVGRSFWSDVRWEAYDADPRVC